MRPPSKIHLRKSIALLVIGAISLSCNLPLHAGLAATPTAGPTQLTGVVNPVSGQPAGAATLASGQPTPGAEAASVENDPLNRLLALRSIKFNLTALSWDGTSRWIDVEIDSAGNMLVKYSLPSVDPKLLPEGVNSKILPTSYELYVVDGKAYQASDQNPDWMATPIYENYLQTLSQQIHGPDGPALWLDLLPEGSIQPEGKDTVGGFATDKYTVNGQVAGQSITGSIWFEPQADALVQVELEVPAALLSDPDHPQQGELRITLNAQKADVPLVTLPSAPAGSASATATP
jgi:hypothetical protein